MTDYVTGNGRDVRILLKSIYFDEFNFKEEISFGRYGAFALRTVGNVVRNIEFVDCTLLHILKALGPSRNYSFKREFCGLSPVIRTIEYFTREQASFIVYLHLIVGSGLLSCALFHNPVF